LDVLKETKEGRAIRQFNEVALETIVGGKRIVAPLTGDPVPRMC
jgi:hydrogenase maturation factor